MMDRRGEKKAPERPERLGGDAPVAAALATLWRHLAALREGEWRARILGALVLTIAAKVIVVAAPLVLADALNKLAAGPNDPSLFEPFLALALAWGLLRFLAAAMPLIRDWLFQPVTEEAQRRIAVAVFGHVHSLSIRFHQTKRTGSLFRTIERGVRAIDFLLRFVAFNIGPTIFELVLAAGVLGWRYGWGFSAIASLTVVIYAAVTFSITNWRLQFRRAMNEKEAEATGRAVDSLMNFETVKAFAAEAEEVRRYDGLLRDYAAAAIKSNATLTAMNGAQSLVQNLGLAAMVVLAGRAVTGAEMGIGDITAVTLVMLNLYAPLNVLGFAYREIKQGAIDMENMVGLLNEKPEVADRQGATDLKITAGHIQFDRVSFTHDARLAGLSDVRFEVPAGGRVAIVGPSGAGKSTILKLLFRFYDPDEGRILIDGQDLRDVTQTSLRRAIGLVPQDVVLFNDTLAMNIGYGTPGASDTQIQAAASLAKLDALIAAAPQGLNTKVGERGLKLSGGERQRVGIARAVLANPPILVLDEATSSLDSGTEAEVQAALDLAEQGRTTLVVAHRLSTIADADLIIVLDQGRVAEMGRHEQLIAADGLYASLWARQSDMAGAEPRLSGAAQ